MSTFVELVTSQPPAWQAFGLLVFLAVVALVFGTLLAFVEVKLGGR